mmetsp:Transcript_5029/g.7383  ORF Transcript_5029/g.7383 Transcript_5029/m.7383 type:complete len:173 (-) Transcript_5029:92-610(-)
MTTSLQQAVQKPIKGNRTQTTSPRGSFEASFVGGLDFSEFTSTSSGTTANIPSASAQHLQRKELARRQEEDHAREEEELMAQVAASIHEKNNSDENMGRKVNSSNTSKSSGSGAMDFLGNTLAQMHGEDRNGGNSERKNLQPKKKKKGVNDKKRGAVKKMSMAKRFKTGKRR